MNILSDFSIRVHNAVPETDKDKEIASLTRLIQEKEDLITKYKEEVNILNSMISVPSGKTATEPATTVKKPSPAAKKTVTAPKPAGKAKMTTKKATTVKKPSPAAKKTGGAKTTKTAAAKKPDDKSGAAGKKAQKGK
jgi:hypothetical protein